MLQSSFRLWDHGRHPARGREAPQAPPPHPPGAAAPEPSRRSRGETPGGAPTGHAPGAGAPLRLWG